jgi:hypothetical protein
VAPTVNDKHVYHIEIVTNPRASVNPIQLLHFPV